MNLGDWLREKGPARRPWHWGGAMLGLWLLLGLYVVPPRQCAVVRAFGAVIGRPAQPGLHWRPAWPVTRLNRVNLRESKRASVGLQLEDEVLAKSPAASRSEFLTGDENIINVALVVHYQIVDPVAYVFRAAEVGKLVARACEQALTRAVAEMAVDSALTTGRVALQNRVKADAQATLERQYGVGVQLLSASIRAATAPPQVADAFAAVADAREERYRIVREAETYYNDQVPLAEGDAAKALREAEGYEQKVVNEARGDARRFEQALAEYRRARRVTRKRLYLEAAEEVIPKMRVVIVDDRHGQQPLDLGILRPAP
ncbi:MAG: FtsH protease activity modulator HflK [Armatimonadota bacterium]